MSLDGPLQLLAVLPIALAVGVDLYLSLVFLAAVGLGGWQVAYPGALGDLAVPGILVAAALLYVLERWMEARTLRAILWNGVHTVIRPVAGGLLVHLALSDLPWPSAAAAAVGAAALTLAVHATRSGWGLLLGLVSTRPRARFLLSVAEDVGVLALLSLLLDAPLAGVGLSVFLAAVGFLRGEPGVDVFLFELRLLRDAFGTLARDQRWSDRRHFPAWIARAIAPEPGAVSTAAIRGSRAAAVNLAGAGPFRRGWLILRAGSPSFLYRRRFRTRRIDLGATTWPVEVTSAALHTRLDLGAEDGRPSALYFSLDGPGADDLRAEFLG